MNSLGKKRTQEEKSREMRTRLIEATLDCLQDNGYHGTSLSRILENAGVSRGAWRHHYRSKKELIAAAAAEYLFEGAIQKAREAIPNLARGQDPIRCFYGNASRKERPWIVEQAKHRKTVRR